MIKSIAYTIAALVVVFIVIVAAQSSDFKVERSITIAAPTDTVFANVNNLHTWEQWSPWAKLDPKATSTYEGTDSGIGTGSKFSWSSENPEVGVGSMTIVESTQNQLIKIFLEFKKPFEGTNDAQFSFVSAENSTTVTWQMTGKKNFIMKAVGLFMNCDKIVGGQFEKGLDSLKALSEKAA